MRYLGDAALPFKLSAPRGVHGILRQTAGRGMVLWVLANVGFKDAVVGRMRQDFLPVQNVGAQILIPEGREVKSVKLLRAGGSIPFPMEGKYAVASIPVLHIAELVHWQLSATL